MILSDDEIHARMEYGDLVIDHLESVDMQIQPASVDLRLAGHPSFRIFTKVGRTISFSEDMATHMIPKKKECRLVIQPGQFALATTIERVGLPNDLVGRVEGRSSLGRVGLLVHATAGFIDPGFIGQITLELYNLQPNPLELEAGMRICQISFQKMTGPASRPYGEQRGSKYQYQKGPTPSRIHQDKK